MAKILIPTEYERLFDKDWRNALIEGGRFSLKSHTVARYLLIQASMAKKRIFCGREFQNSIADSSHQLLADLIEEYNLGFFNVTRDSILNVKNGSDFLFRGIRHNAQSIKSIEGIDIAWVEEAQAITRESIDILTPTVRKPGSQIIWTMNRTLELDPIYELLALNPRDDTLHLTINYDIAEKYGWLPPEIKAEIEHDKLHNPEIYAHKWLGQPMSQVNNAIVGREAILNAMQRTADDEGAIEVGVDVARFGDDRSEFVKRKGHKEIGRETYQKLDLIQLAERLELFVHQDKSVLIKIDDTGVGGGLTDIMKSRGYNIMPINFGAKANDPDKYPNLISEAWFHIASIINDIQLRQDNDLLMELSSRQWVMDSKGRRGVESKDSYKKRGYRSPDKADATILCFYTPKVTPFEFEFI